MYNSFRMSNSSKLDFETYQSPYTLRYGSQEMRSIWSEANKRRIWRQIWVALAEVQSEFGLVRPDQVEDLRQKMLEINISRSFEIEAEIHHDLMAELKTFAEQCPIGGAILHLGATSSDIEDNADALRLQQSFDLLISRLGDLLSRFAEKIQTWADLPLMAFTHLQPAEPSTLGYRLACYAQDLLLDWENLHRERDRLRGKGFKGAVGTRASFVEMVGIDRVTEFEGRLSERLGLTFFPVTTQTYPRKQDYHILNALAGLGASLHKFAFDLRVLQSPQIGELAEPFGPSQVGSSAMPFKRNPINAEKMDSLSRSLAQLPRLAWDNAAFSLLERTLDDSANRRSLLPEAFLICDELLMVGNHILAGLQVDHAAIRKNLETYGPFAATERLLLALTNAGADRQEVHERLRIHAMQAWQSIQHEQPNPLVDLVAQDESFRIYLDSSQIRALMDIGQYFGDAPRRARELAERIIRA